MRIHCICLVRDEADILRYTLDAALGWAHAIYIGDHCSTDGTWELILEYARNYPQVVVVGRYSGNFRDSFRGDIARQVLNEAQDGDWWCRLDADELYVDRPSEFLRQVSPRHRVVYSASIEYFFTDRDLAHYENSPQHYVRNWHPETLRHYIACWSEGRFVRHSPGMSWTDAWPDEFSTLSGAPQRIRLRHYQYRSPPQIQRRVCSRLSSTEAFLHEKVPLWTPTGRKEDLCFPSPDLDEDLWRSRVVRAGALHHDDGSGQFQIDWHMMPPVQAGDACQSRTSRGERVLRRIATLGSSVLHKLTDSGR
jgi:hypothetical protein